MYDLHGRRAESANQDVSQKLERHKGAGLKNNNVRKLKLEGERQSSGQNKSDKLCWQNRLQLEVEHRELRYKHIAQQLLVKDSRLLISELERTKTSIKFWGKNLNQQTHFLSVSYLLQMKMEDYKFLNDKVKFRMVFSPENAQLKSISFRVSYSFVHQGQCTYEALHAS